MNPKEDSVANHNPVGDATVTRSTSHTVNGVKSQKIRSNKVACECIDLFIELRVKVLLFSIHSIQTRATRFYEAAPCSSSMNSTYIELHAPYWLLLPNEF